MADFWTTPKINWVTNDGIGFEDLNRMEANTSAVRDATRLKLQGFGYTINNLTAPDDALITIQPGSGYSTDGIPIHMSSAISKNLNPFVQGTGVGGLAAGAVTLRDTWYYVFVIMDPTDGSTDIMIDDNPAGTNVVSGTFTVKRFVNSFKTRSIAGAILKFVEMYSTGDDVFINPISMFDPSAIKFDNSSSQNNEYRVYELEGDSGSDGFALPAKTIMARLNVNSFDIVAFGFLSDFQDLYTIPANLNSGSDFFAEILKRVDPAALDGYMSANFSILVDLTSKVNIAMINPSSGDADSFIDIQVVGYTDERLA